MKCECGSTSFTVWLTRKLKVIGLIRRVIVCKECSSRYETREKILKKIAPDK